MAVLPPQHNHWRMMLLLLLCSTTHASSWFTTKKQQPKQRTKPNILVLLADDHSAEALGYRGKARLSPLIKQLNVTPHLDRLSKEGITTEHAYTINALCTPARASILISVRKRRTRSLPYQSRG